jgi:hypothetical protein
MDKIGNACKLLIGKPARNASLRRLKIWENNIKMYLKKITVLWT